MNKSQPTVKYPILWFSLMNRAKLMHFEQGPDVVGDQTLLAHIPDA